MLQEIKTYHDVTQKRIKVRRFVNEAGQKDGLYMRFNSFGEPLERSTYSNGKEVKKWLKKKEEHRIHFFEESVDNGAFESYNLYGDLREKGSHKNGQLDGVYTLYESCGNLRMRFVYRDGKENGPYERYLFGCLSEKGFYRDGRKHGAYERYFENGRIDEKGFYKEGILDGTFERYWSNGHLRESLVWENNRLNGPYKMYNEKGCLVVERMYRDGVAVSPITIAEADRSVGRRKPVHERE